jgi:Domain of unknown function (DUF4160)
MIYVNDHPPPHFHAKAGEFATGDVLEGLLPRAKLRKLQDWFRRRQEELAFVWTEIQARRYRGGLIG